MFSDDYIARVNEIAGDPDIGIQGERLRRQVFAGLDEVLVEVFSRDRDEWADAFDGLDMPRCAKAINRQIQP